MFDSLGILALGEVPQTVVPVVVQVPGSKWGSKRRRKKRGGKYLYQEVEEVPQWKLALEAANEAKFQKLVEEERLRLIREKNFSQPRKPVDVSIKIKEEIEQRISPHILEIKDEIKQRLDANNEKKLEQEMILRDRIKEMDREESLERARKAIADKRQREQEIKEQRLKNLKKARRVKKRNRI